MPRAPRTCSLGSSSWSGTPNCGPGSPTSPGGRGARAGATTRSGRLPDALLREVEHGAETGLGEAPVIVVVCGDVGLGLEVTLPSSVYPATQNLLLAAGALGLGSAMTTLATLFADDLRRLLELPETVRPMAVVPIGWPGRPLGPPRRLPVRQRAHLDRYGHPECGPSPGSRSAR